MSCMLNLMVKKKETPGPGAYPDTKASAPNTGAKSVFASTTKRQTNNNKGKSYNVNMNVLIYNR